jgi:hypothetical protein
MLFSRADDRVAFDADCRARPVTLDPNAFPTALRRANNPSLLAILHFFMSVTHALGSTTPSQSRYDENDCGHDDDQ